MKCVVCQQEQAPLDPSLVRTRTVEAPFIEVIFCAACIVSEQVQAAQIAVAPPPATEPSLTIQPPSPAPKTRLYVVQHGNSGSPVFVTRARAQGS
jgi:hypothetical protein